MRDVAHPVVCTVVCNAMKRSLTQCDAVRRHMKYIVNIALRSGTYAWRSAKRQIRVSPGDVSWKAYRSTTSLSPWQLACLQELGIFRSLCSQCQIHTHPFKWDRHRTLALHSFCELRNKCPLGWMVVPIYVSLAGIKEPWGLWLTVCSSICFVSPNFLLTDDVCIIRHN